VTLGETLVSKTSAADQKRHVRVRHTARLAIAAGVTALLGVMLAPAVSFASPSSGSGMQGVALRGDTFVHTYVVLYKLQDVPQDAARKIVAAGGTVAYRYRKIGVVIARSDDSAFRTNLLAADPRVENATSATGFGVPSDFDSYQAADDKAPVQVVRSKPATDAETLSNLEWDMPQIHTPEAHRVTLGKRNVVVGDIDTGVDITHPDLAANIDYDRSVSCLGGVPDQNPAAWNDDVGHGTHTAGTIAAAVNGFGIEAVAPNVKLAAIKAGDVNNLFFPEAVVCAFMWAADKHIDVTNNSYYADPYLFNCPNDPEQRAIFKAEQRAIRYAMTQGVTVIAAENNQNMDLANPTVDDSSPDFPPGTAVTRPVTKDCIIVPTEIEGVVSVSATGNLRQKALYSNYGHTDVSAPGGDSFFQLTLAAPNGRVLSTWPAAIPATRGVQDCSVTPCATYAYQQGTSMSSPHVAGIAALMISRFGKMTPTAVRAHLKRTADPIACPPNPFLAGTPFEANCSGRLGNNSFYGAGEVNALQAVTTRP